MVDLTTFEKWKFVIWFLQLMSTSVSCDMWHKHETPKKESMDIH